MSPVPLAAETAVVVSIAAWIAIGLATGFLAHRMPVSSFDHDTWITRPRPVEHGGRFYERRLHIRRWKDLLPEKGDLFRGGFSKRHMGNRATPFLERFAAETRRAELVHWANAMAGPLFFLWCPPAIALIMVTFGWVAHLPFICIQRYNRARIQRTLARRARRPAPLAPNRSSDA